MPPSKTKDPSENKKSLRAFAEGAELTKKDQRDVNRLVRSIEKIKDPRDLPGILQQVLKLTLSRVLPESMSKTAAYIAQTWQTSYREKVAHEEKIKMQQDQIWLVDIVDGQPRKSRLAEMGEYPHLLRSSKDEVEERDIIKG